MSSASNQRGLRKAPAAGTNASAAVPAPLSSLGPKARLGHFQDALPALFARAVQACVDAGMTKTAVAEHIGVQRPHLYDMIDGHKAIQPWHLMALPEPGRLVIAAAMAGDGHVVVYVPAPDAVAGSLVAMREAHKASTALVDEVMESLGDDIVTPSEGGRLIQVGERMLRVAGGFVALGRRAVDHGVQGVPRAVRGGVA